MENSTLKKTTLLALAAGLLVLPACGWRKKKRVCRPVVITKKEEFVELPTHHNHKKLVFDEATEQLMDLQDDEPLFVAHDSHTMDDNFTFDQDNMNLEDINNQEESTLVYFDYNKKSPSADQTQNLSLAVQKAQEIVAQGKKVVVKAHSCELGQKAHLVNLPLSQTRAEELADYLITKANIPAEAITAFGVGSEEPVTLEHTLEAQNCNRRAEIYGITA